MANQVRSELLLPVSRCLLRCALRETERRVVRDALPGREARLEDDNRSISVQRPNDHGAPRLDLAGDEPDQGVLDGFPLGDDDAVPRILLLNAPLLGRERSFHRRHDNALRGRKRVGARLPEGHIPPAPRPDLMRRTRRPRTAPAS